MSIPEIFYINLDRSVDRRRRIEAGLGAAGLTGARLPAIDGVLAMKDWHHCYDAGEAKRALGRLLLPGELGCYLSHVAAARLAAQAKSDWVLILEDDAIIPSDCSQRLRSIAFSLPESVGIVNLSRQPRHQITMLDPRIGVVRAHYFPVTTTALLWRPRAAREFLSVACPIRYPIDVFLQKWVTKENIGAALLDPLIPPDGSESVIYAGRRSEGKGGRFLYHYKRLRRTIGNRLNARKHQR